MDPLTATAASGLRARMESLDLLANNVANAATGGYKADREFYSLYADPEAADSGSASAMPLIEKPWTDLSQGVLQNTGGPFDLALSGRGFFAVNGPSGPLYTRNGSFRLAAEPRGLRQGADDYLVKPFAFPELLARLRALHRRANPDSPSVLQVADLRMDTRGHTVTRGTFTIDLTLREFELLEYLLIHRGTVVSREMVARDVWKTTVRYTSLDNVIDVHIARIRRKIDDQFPLKLLHTVRGVGFVLRGEEEA